LLEKAREKKRKSKGKQKKKKHEDDMSDEEIAQQLEGWLTCERCVVSKHWVGLISHHNDEADGQGCLLGNEKKQTLEDLQAQEGPVEHGCRKIRGVGIDEEASFLCSRCRDDPRCLVCHNDKLPKETQDKIEAAGEDHDMDADDRRGHLRFRCFRCKQEAHYEHCKLAFLDSLKADKQ
jgi:hypothetical protein